MIGRDCERGRARGREGEIEKERDRMCEGVSVSEMVDSTLDRRFGRKMFGYTRDRRL